MPSIKLIISDLHLADGHAILDGFGDAQQAALEGLLEAANGIRPLGQAANEVELIINGDCFDFLVIPPFQTDSTTDPATALGKLEKIIAAHRPFFEVLHKFLSLPGRSVTFLTGNHDIELCFEEVRTRIGEAIYGQAVILSAVSRSNVILSDSEGPEETKGKDLSPGRVQILRCAQDDKSCDTEGYGVHFCTSRFYRPLPDVYIEHGNQYDFWNHMSGIWDERGHALTLSPDKIPLPFGSQYVLRVGHPISLAHPYFDHFEPSMNILRQTALLSLLDPDLTVATAERLMGMLSYPRKPLAALAPGEERIAARLFEHAMLDFLAFQQDVEARSPGWKTFEAKDDSLDNSHTQGSSANTKAQEDSMTEFLALRDALTLPPIQAIAAICTPAVYSMGEDVARGMQHILNGDSTLRYAIAGHSHMWRIDPIHNGMQTYLNTGTWTTRVALPTPESVTPALVEWLRQPDWRNIPLRDMTQCMFVMIFRSGDGPSEARLCVWNGGVNGSYKVLGE